MRDLLSKLDALISETELRDKEDLQAKRKALQDLQMDPIASKDPEIRQAIIQRKADLEKEAQTKGFDEGFEIDRSDLKPAHDKGYSDASNGIDDNPFDPETPAFKSYREGQMAYKRSFGESAFEVGDDFGISFTEDFEIATEIVGFVEDGIVIDLDDAALEMLANEGIVFLEGELSEGLRDPKDNPCWKGYKPVGTKKKGGRTVPNCVPKESIEEEEDVDEAKYRGKEVPLGKKLPGDVKKSKVYVRKPNGNIVKVNFGDKKMRIKKSNPKRRKSFRARHNCKNPGPRWKARYWSCRSW